MTVETGVSFIADLNENYPRKADLIKEGDDHLRLIKAVLKTTLPGFTRAVTMSAETLNLFNTNITMTSDNTRVNTGLSVAVNKTIDVGANKITNVGDPTNDQDAVTKKYLSANAQIAAWPVGSIYLSVDTRNPNAIFGFGTWIPFAEGRVLIGAGTGTDSRGEARPFALNQTGGAYQHVLTVAEMAAHDHAHNLTGSTNPAGQHSHSIQTHPERMSIHDIGGNWFRGGGTVNYTDPAGEHTHTVVIQGAIAARGSNNSHNIVQPFMVCNIWRRTS